jgi:hypothetical protein
MEYVAFHGTYHDIPVEAIVAAWEEAYGKERVKKWIEDLGKAKGKPVADFQSEEVWD